MQTRNLDLNGPAGRLEAVLSTPSGEPTATALLCHAHPLHGGTLHFKLLFRVAKVFQSCGHAVLRFHFRGVGRSAGEFDRGRGEADDARAALDFLAREYEGLPIVHGGFSFGAAIALRTGIRDERVKALFLMGLPVLAIESASENPFAKPVLFVQGERDEFGGGPAIAEFVRSFEGPKTLAVVPGSGHLFEEGTAPVEAALREWLGNLA